MEILLIMLVRSDVYRVAAYARYPEMHKSVHATTELIELAEPRKRLARAIQNPTPALPMFSLLQ
jgi:hypothetical protein